MIGPFRARFGDVDLLVTSFDTTAGRDWTIHSPTRGDEHTVQDRGRSLRTANCQICFCDEPAQREDYMSRYEAFRDLVNDGTPQLFTHPLDGSFLAVIQGFRASVSADSPEVLVSCDVIALQEPQAVFQIGAGVNPAAGPEEVGVTVARCNVALADLGLESDVPTSCLAKVEEWATATDPDARAILLELGSATQRIDEEITRLDLLTNYSRWELYKGFIDLRYQLGRAAETVIADTARMVDYTVRVAAPLRVIVARIYGATGADDRTVEVAKLNGLKRPGLVAAGTSLKVPAP